MSDILWAADAVMNGKTVRAEYTTDSQFECTEPSVRRALFDATLTSLAVRPINMALGITDVDRNDPASVASLVFNVLLATDPDVEFTFYGTGYLYPQDPPDQGALDTLQPEVVESADQPASQFGFEWPPPAVKGLNDDEFKRSRQRLLDAMAKAKTPAWSEQVVVQRQKALADHYAPLIGKAIYAGLSGIPAAIKQAQAKYAAATKAAGNASGAGKPAPATTAATQAVSNTVKVNQSQAEQILRYLYGDSYLAGAQAAGAQIGDGATMIPSVSKYVGDIDWDAWEPGDAHVASYLADGGLSNLLDEGGIDIKSLLGDIYQSALDRLGNTMADGIASGLNVDQIASSIEDQVSANAYMIANTETARATSAATMDTYDENDVEKFNWLAEDDACQTCRDNADDGPYNVGSQGTDDSDAPEQPEHPNCRCCYLPVITVDGENVAPTSDEGDQSSGGDSGLDQEPPV